MSKPEISVIVPIYKTAPYLSACLDSVLAQTFENYEIICVNDGSPDNAMDILKQYAQRDSRIKIIDQKNAGIVHARNNAIASARGKYIFPLDSDDMIAPSCLDVLYQTITTTKYSVVCPAGIKFGLRNCMWRLPRVNRLNMYARRNAIHNSSLFPKSLWEKYGGYCTQLNALCGEDYDFWLCFIDDRKKVARIKQPLFFYRIKPVDESRNRPERDKAELANKIIAQRHPKIRFYYRFRQIFKPFLVFFR